MSIRDNARQIARARNITNFSGDRIVTVEEALVESGCNWDVEERTMAFSSVPHRDAESVLPSEHRWTLATERKAIVRSDTGALLGDVGAGYGVLQNAVAFDFMKPWVDTGKARIIKAGYTGQGERVFIEAVIVDESGQPRRVPIRPGSNDLIEDRLISWNGHDGGCSATTGRCPYRVVCTNGMIVMIPKYNMLLKMRHTGKLAERVQRFQDFLLKSETNFDNLMDAFRAMGERRVNMEQFETYAKQVLGWNEKKEAESKISEPRAMDTLRRLFISGKGQNLPTAKQNAFGAYNAFTEWLSHERGKDERRYEMATFGSGLNMRNKAFTAALALADS